MIKLNLLPKNLRKRVEPGWWRLITILVPLATIGILSFYHLSVLSRIHTLENQKTQLEVQVQQLQPFIEEQNQLSRQRDQLQKILTVAKKVHTNFVPWSDYLATFINEIPRRESHFGVSLRSINTQVVAPSTAQAFVRQGLYNGKVIRVQLTIQGQARNREALIGFIRTFESAPNLGINFQQASLDQGSGHYSFSATIGMAKLTEGGITSAQSR